MINEKDLIKDIKECKAMREFDWTTETLISLLESAPKVSQWISVSERLPEKSDVYLTTFLEEGKRYVERFYYSDFMGWMMPVAWQDEGRIENIIAWQPLPEPWKGGGL